MLVLIAKTTAFLTLIWIAHAALARRNPRWRVALWRAMTVGVAAVSALAWIPPIVPLRLARPASPAAFGRVDHATDLPAAASVPTYPDPPGPGPLQSIKPKLLKFPEPRAEMVRAVPESDASRADLGGSTIQPSTSVRKGPAFDRDRIGLWLTTAWAAGVVLLSWRLLRDARRLSGVIGRAAPASGAIVEECDALAARLGCSRAVRVVRSAEVLTPCIASARRPVLLLPVPADLESDAEELRAILGHELAHVKGRDLIWNHALHAVSTLLWFHPLAWRARKAHATACDAVCDALAVDAIGDVSAYCRALARLALRMSGRPSTVHGLAMARKADVRRRIEFLNHRVFRHAPPRSLTVPAIFAFCLSAFLVGSLGITRAEPGEEGVPNKPSEEKTAVAQEKQAPGNSSPARRKVGGLEARVATVTITGRAVDQDGHPVQGAVIQVANDNAIGSGDDHLGGTTSGADGRFVMRDVAVTVLTPQPSAVPKPREARFEVSGWAPGKAFAWHPSQSYRPEPRPAKVDPKDDGTVFHEGEIITADLIFGPPARLSGTVTDDLGKPVEGALVQVGVVNNVRRPGGSGMWGCSAIAPNGEDVPFKSIRLLPEALRSTHTDARGRYAIEGLPREVKLLALIDHEPTYKPHSFTIATSETPFDGVKSLGYDGTMNHVFTVPRVVRIRATSATSGDSINGATVIARGPGVQRSGARATTDAQGMATLHLQPGDYTLRAEPPVGVPAVVAETPLKVVKETRETALDMRLNPSVPLNFEAVDEATGAGVAGVRFVYETDVTRVRRPVSSQTVYVDHPKTDGGGRLAVMASPGLRRFFPDRVPGFEPIEVESPLLTLEAGKPRVVRFAFRRVAVPENRSPETPPSKDETVRRLQEQWASQAALARKGRARASRYYQPSDGIAPADFVRLMNSLGRDVAPPMLERIRKAFPNAEPASGVTLEMISDDPKRRETTIGEDGRSKSWIVTNGMESVHVDLGNAQADVFDDSPRSAVRLAIDGVANYCHFDQGDAAIVGRVDGIVTLERTRNTIVADEKTGFLYRDTFTYNNGEARKEYWGFAPRVTPEGLVFPSLSVQAEINQDRISAIWIRMVESVDLHSPIPPEAFAAGAPAGILLLDYRGGREDTYRGVLSAPVTDLVAWADEIATKRKQFIPPVKPGDAAPTLQAVAWVDQKGKTAPPQLDGKVVLVDFWGVTCGPCVAQLPEVRKAVEYFHETDLRIIGLHDSSGTVEEVAEFAAKRGITYPLAIDRKAREAGWFGETFAAYGVQSIPGAAVLDRNRRIVFVGRFTEALEKAAELLKSSQPSAAHLIHEPPVSRPPPTASKR